MAKRANRDVITPLWLLFEEWVVPAGSAAPSDPAATSGEGGEPPAGDDPAERES
jgi:hypothetical protein